MFMLFCFQIMHATNFLFHLLVLMLPLVCVITLFTIVFPLSSLQGVSNGWASQIYPPGYFSIETSLYSARKSNACVWLILVFSPPSLSSSPPSTFLSSSPTLFFSFFHSFLHPLLFSYAELLLWVSGYLFYACIDCLVFSLPRAAEVRTCTLRRSDNIPPSDNAINEAEFTYNTQRAAFSFSARQGVQRAKRAPLCQRQLWRATPAGRPLELSRTNDTRNTTTTPTFPAWLTLLMLTMPANTATSTLGSPLRVKTLSFARGWWGR